MRRFVIAAAALLLGSCALRPMYAGGTSGTVAETLRHVTRGADSRPQRLARLQQAQGQAAARSAAELPPIRLDVELDDQIIGLGIRGDRAATRERRTLRARYQLVTVSNGQVVLDATAGSDAGIDVVSSEYATIAAEQSAVERLADVVADQIVARLALYATRTSGSK